MYVGLGLGGLRLPRSQATEAAVTDPPWYNHISTPTPHFEMTLINWFQRLGLAIVQQKPKP